MEINLRPKSRERLLYDLCVKYGFCLPPEGYDRIMDEPPTDLSEFVELIFLLEGLDPETANIRLKRKVRDLIVHAHQQDAVV
ncbi:MAG: hypothetical protein KJO98_04765 [Rhodothermia bacterium]|nr:hypothetical protein [Rhodothermia bacterium]